MIGRCTSVCLPVCLSASLILFDCIDCSHIQTRRLVEAVVVCLWLWHCHWRCHHNGCFTQSTRAGDTSNPFVSWALFGCCAKFGNCITIDPFVDTRSFASVIGDTHCCLCRIVPFSGGVARRALNRQVDYCPRPAAIIMVVVTEAHLPVHPANQTGKESMHTGSPKKHRKSFSLFQFALSLTLSKHESDLSLA